MQIFYFGRRPNIGGNKEIFYEFGHTFV